MKLSKINDSPDNQDDALETDYSDMLNSLFTDDPILSAALEPKDEKEKLKDKLSSMVDVATYGRSSGMLIDKDKDKH